MLDDVDLCIEATHFTLSYLFYTANMFILAGPINVTLILLSFPLF